MGHMQGDKSIYECEMRSDGHGDRKEGEGNGGIGGSIKAKTVWRKVGSTKLFIYNCLA